MTPTCLFDILTLPAEELRRLLPLASSRTLARLAVAYPRAARSVFIETLSHCTSSVTREFLEEEITHIETPSYSQIRDAEADLLNLLHTPTRR